MELMDDSMVGPNPIVPEHQIYGSDLPWISSDNLLEHSLTTTKQTFMISPFAYYSSPPLLASAPNQLTTILDFSKEYAVSCKETDDIEAAAVMETNLQARKVRSAPVVKNTWQAQEHLMAERKRREKIGQLFINLSKVLPGIKKLDKVSLLEDAINYTKALQERVRALEEELQASVDDNSKPSTRRDEGVSKNPPAINVRISDRSVLIRIHCKKHEGFMARIHMAMERMNLSVADLRIMPFGANIFLDITILAQMQGEFWCTVKDIVHQLEKAFFIQ